MRPWRGARNWLRSIGTEKGGISSSKEFLQEYALGAANDTFLLVLCARWTA